MTTRPPLPKGTLVWPKLNEPDDFKGKKEYKANIKFSDEDHRKVDAWLKKVAKEFGHPNAKLPWKKDKKTGEITLYVHTKKPPLLLDAPGNEVPRSKVKVGGGTVAKVAVFPKWYDVQGPDGSVTLYISSVQIIELKVAQRHQVEAEAGFTYNGGPDDEDEPDAQDYTDDDIPF